MPRAVAITAVLALLAGPAACALLPGCAGLRAARHTTLPRRAVTVLAEEGSDPPAAESEPPAPAEPAKEEELSGIEKAMSWFNADDPEPPPPAFVSTLSDAEEAVLVKAMRAAKMVWFGVPYATKTSGWDGARAAEPLLANRSDEELYVAYMAKPRRF